ncbi:M60 family metallopeptidase [Bacteroides caccae]|jgi:hypothetical protein|uniref:M60 family metallopeptidase n=1 Tax=Bacteroides caccae TaxID=47678 RepID=UPI0032F02BEF
MDRKIVLVIIGLLCSLHTLNADTTKKNTFDPLVLFTDQTCSELKQGLTEKKILCCKDTDFKEVALKLHRGIYDREFRIQEYKEYQHPDIMGKKNKTNAYSLLDNATGIVAKKGKELIVAVGDTHEDNIRIKIQNLIVTNDDGYDKSSSYYSLSAGINRIIPQNDGLIYVLYHGEQANSDKKVKIHFISGEVNGYFDISKHEPSQWKTLLEKANYGVFDVLGKYTHLTFPTESFRQYTPDGKALIDVFDRIVRLEHEFMGLDKYTDRQYNNRQYCHVIYKGYMYAPNYRTAYGIGTMEKICDVNKLTGIALWGPSHEIGHINQIRPGAKWHGMTEVTNNIYCLYVQTGFGQTTRVQKEVEHPTNTYDNCWYERAMTDYFTQPLAHNANPINHCRLIPFWQLYLYLSKVKEMDFYPDLLETIRRTPDPETAGLCQLEFIKKACKVSNMDLTPFFEKYGFLTPIEKEVNDYGKKKFVITKKQIEETKKEIASGNYKKVNIPFWYISDYTVPFFRNPQPVSTGTAICKGNTFTMYNWNRVVAYEVYQKGKLVFVSPLSHFTVENVVVTSTTHVYAIGADGSKKEVKFQWSEGLPQPMKTGAGNSQYNTMYNR